MVVNHWCNAQFVLNRVCLRMGCTSQMVIFNGENDDIHWNWSFCSFPMDKPGNCYPIHEGTHHQTQKGPQPLCTFMRYLQFVAYLCFGCLLSEFYCSILQFFLFAPFFLLVKPNIRQLSKCAHQATSSIMIPRTKSLKSPSFSTRLPVPEHGWNLSCTLW